MPESYPVNWDRGGWGPQVGDQLMQAQAIFRQANEREKERQRLAEQEQYERAQAEMDRARLAADDERKAKAFEWEENKDKLAIQEAKLNIAKRKHEMATQEAQRQGSEFLAAEPAAAQHQEAYFAPGEQPGEQAPPGGLPNAPAQVQIPAIPGTEPGEPDIVAARTVSPFQMARAALEAKKAADEAEGLSSGRLVQGEGGVLPASVVNARETAKQRAETAKQHQETLRAVAATKAQAGLSPAQESVVVNRLTSQWDKAGVTDRELQRQFRMMNDGMKAAKAGDRGAGSQAILVTFQKILDPESVVRESEYARSEAGQSLIGRIEGSIEKLRKGGANLTPEQLQPYLDLANQFVKGGGQFRKALKGRIQKTGQRYNIPDDVLFEDEDEQPAGQIDPEVEKRLKALGY